MSWNPSEARLRPTVDGGRLWAGGLAAAAVAALTATVGVLVVRGVFGVDFLAPARAGAWGDASTTWLVLMSAGGALAATALLHVLLLAAPEPFRFFRWIVGLLTAGVAVWPFATDAGLGAKISSAVVYTLIGVAIGSLVGSAGMRSLRPVDPR